MSGSVVLLQQGSVLMSVVQVTIEGQANIQGLDCHQRPGGYQRAKLLPGAMSGSMVLIVAGVYVDNPDPHYHQTPCRYPCSGLPPELALPLTEQPVELALVSTGAGEPALRAGNLIPPLLTAALHKLAREVLESSPWWCR